MAYTTIKKPSDYFNTVTYVANETDDRQITVGFQPDFTWLKDRDQAVSHDLYDAVRGATKSISSNNANSEATQTDGLKSFNSTGFTLGTGWGNQTTGDDYVSWNWLTNNTSGSSNTDGSTTSTVSANTTSGFSIVKYTGPGGASTVGHGLGSAPKVVIVKNITAPYNLGWRVYHYSAGATKTLYLNENNAATTDSAVWNNTAPTSTVFSVGSASEVSADYTDFIAYCFTDVKGFSKIGSYTGNGNADGTFIYTGFKPAWFLFKNNDSLGSWIIKDNKRLGYNGIIPHLQANTNDTENTDGWSEVDFLSNGIKLRNADSSMNGSGVSFIYMAFAEEPLVGDNPATAR